MQSWLQHAYMSIPAGWVCIGSPGWPQCNCSRMGRDIAVKNAATSHFHHHEHVQHSEASRDGYQEVSGHDGLGVIADKRPPVLRSCSPTASRIPLLWAVRPHSSGGDT